MPERSVTDQQLKAGDRPGEAEGMSEVKKSSLSPAGQRLVALMQSVNFGEIRDLHVRDGQPLFLPAPAVVRLVKLGADNRPRPECEGSDFLIKSQILELLEELGRFGNGRVLRIGIKHGIPTDLALEEWT
jgi:hypothetical protein